MKIKTKKQLLITLIFVNLLVFGAIGAVLYYYDGIRVLAPLFAVAAVMIVMQYNIRKKQLPQAE
jgi:hypothetical protein